MSLKPEELRDAYNELLQPNNMTLLIELAEDIHRRTVDIFVKMKCVRNFNPRVRDPRENPDFETLQVLRRDIETTKGRMPFWKLPGVFEDKLEKHNNINRKWIERRCYELSRLFWYIQELRNCANHSRQLTKHMLRSAASAILHATDLAYPEFPQKHKIENLEKLCQEALARVDDLPSPRSVSKERERAESDRKELLEKIQDRDETIRKLKENEKELRVELQKRQEKNQELIKTLDELPKGSEITDQIAALIAGERHKTVGKVHDEVKAVVVGEHEKIHKIYKRIEDIFRKISGAVEQNESRKEWSARLDGLDSGIKDRMGRLDARVHEHIERGLAELLDSLRKDIAKLTSAEGIGVRKTGQKAESGDTGVAQKSAKARVDWQQKKRLDPTQAEKALRELRDEIRKEMRLDPWRNICMTNPIVWEAVREATRGGLKELDDWKKLPSVKKKFESQEAQADRDLQLKRYGENMMEIYRRIEQTSGDEGFLPIPPKGSPPEHIDR